MRSRGLLFVFSVLSAATCAKMSDAAAQADAAPDASPGMSPVANHALNCLPQPRMSPALQACEERRNPVDGQ